MIAATRTVDAAGRDEASAWVVPASFALHAMLVVALAFSPAVKRSKRPREESVAVDILTPQQFEAASEPQVAPKVLQAPVAMPPASAPVPAVPPADGVIRATRMLSQEVLANPGSRQARAALATFAETERMVQLCNLEAMEQIRVWRDDFQPEQVVPYATASEQFAGRTIVADGAAFLSRDNWYGLKFKCKLSDDGERVAAFEFLLGDTVPRDRWDELGLTAGRLME
jgi:hypothetical protein